MECCGRCLTQLYYTRFECDVKPASECECAHAASGPPTRCQRKGLQARKKSVAESLGEDAKSLLDEGRADIEALADFPDFPVGYAIRGWYYETAGDQDLALEMWHQAVQRGGSGWIAQHYAVEMFRRKRSVEALKFLNQFRRPGDVLLDVARAYLMAEIPTERSRALETSRTLVASDLGVNTSLFPLAILLLLGEREEARQVSLGLLEPLRTSAMRMGSMALEVMAGRRSSKEVLGDLVASRKVQAMTGFAIAMDLLAQGRREEARSQFLRSATIAGGLRSEAKWSRAFYERLEADPNWPPWIPIASTSATQPTGATATEARQ